MSDFDLIIRNPRVVTRDQVIAVDIGIRAGRIAGITPGLRDSAPEEIDASGLHVLPGLIDSHVHFNDPGRSDWEGIESGSRALAAGGGTMFFDMPLNAHPPTVNAAAFDQKLAVASASSLVDFAFWGGLIPGNVNQMQGLSDRGVIGFKAFMSNSGIEDFPEWTLPRCGKECSAQRSLVNWLRFTRRARQSRATSQRNARAKAERAFGIFWIHGQSKRSWTPLNERSSLPKRRSAHCMWCM